MADERAIIAALSRTLNVCESTGKFPFNSRHFFKVGEWEYAFHGIYRFVEENSVFKPQIREDYCMLLKYFEDVIAKKGVRLPKYEW
jgi:hypothetical protein